ncbi:MAG TPA: hypothetical protein VFB21_21900 [Chthonomonadaceae bacterium]|nr:hypothetical protein [Chthonomonadaceae bacterium]
MRKYQVVNDLARERLRRQPVCDRKNEFPPAGRLAEGSSGGSFTARHQAEKAGQESPLSLAKTAVCAGAERR